MNWRRPFGNGEDGSDSQGQFSSRGLKDSLSHLFSGERDHGERRNGSHAQNGWATRGRLSSLGPLGRFLQPRSLRYQLLSRSLLILSGLLFLIGVFQYFLMQQFLYSNKAQSLQTEVRSVTHVPWQRIATDPASFEKLLNSLRAPDSKVAFIDTDGHFYEMFDDMQGDAPTPLPAQDYADALTAQDPHGKHVNYLTVTNKKGETELVVLQPVGSQNQLAGIVQISTDTGPLQDVLVRQLMIFLLLAVGALVLGLFTFLPILRSTLVPLSRMIETVKRINAGNLDERLQTEEDSKTQKAQLEIQQLSLSFNEMLERLEVSFAAEKEAKEKMRRFVADASHELRTPLTSIHGFLEVLMMGAANNPDQLRMALKSMYGESERLNKLVGDLLFLARQDQEPVLQLSEGRLDQVLHEMEPQLRMLAGEREVVFAAPAEVRTQFDQDRIKQVILNLFQNAVQHTDPSNGRIEVKLDADSAGIALDVKDNGPGIPEEHLPHLFERFYRVDTARARKHGGAGLGLAITKSIVEGHGGTISCTSTVGVGTTFHVRLPKS